MNSDLEKLFHEIIQIPPQGCKTKLFDLVDDNMPLLGGVLGALIGVQVTL